MSLDTLLEAAKYLDHIQKTDSSDGERHDSIGTDSLEDSEDQCLPSATYHLKVDPNVPISVQFHTYTACAAGLQPMAANALGLQSEVVSKTSNVWNESIISTKRNAQQNVGNAVMIDMNNTSTIRPAINSINKNNSFSTNNGNSNTINMSTVNNNNNTNNNNNNTNANNNNNNNNRDKNRDHSSYSRHREMHKTLEKNRRAHLRHCFEVLKDELPPNEYNEKKSSHINIISCAIKYIQHLKRTESELQHQTERLVRTKIRYQSQIAQMHEDLKDLTIKSGNGGVRGVAPLLQTDQIRVNLRLEDCFQFPPIDEQSDEEVIIDLENGDDCYDDETTTTASECADDVRDTSAPTPKLSGPSLANTANPLVYKCHA